MSYRFWVSALVGCAFLAGCKAAEPVKSAGETVVQGAKSVGSAATSLVNVNLSNVLNDLALDLKIDKANIPINAQIPITIAANVCGVSINILSIGAGGGNSGGCTAKTSSPELTQAVQQQLAAGGNVGVGGQTTTTTPTAPQPQPQPQPEKDPNDPQ